MQRMNAIFLTLSALGLGMVVTSLISGCQPTAQDEEASPAVTATTEPAADAPAEEKPAADAPAEEKPAADAPAEEKPAADAPAEEKPAANGVSTADNNPPEDQITRDWPQWGGTAIRNNVPVGKNIPTTWNVGKIDRQTNEWIKDEAVDVKWVSRVGSQTYGNPVVAGGRVYVGTNNSAGYMKRYPANVDLGCLLCFDEKTGKFLWQHSSEKLSTGRVHDWPLQGICCAPLIEGDRVWFVTSRGEVRCVDANGFYDDEDDGPVTGGLAKLFGLRKSENPDTDQVAPALAALADGKLPESILQLFAKAGAELPADAKLAAGEAPNSWVITAKVAGHDRQFQLAVKGPTLSGFKVIATADKQEADVIWIYDMMRELGVSQHNMCSCSVTALGDILFVATSNGLDESHINLPAPGAPSFIAMNKHTGEVYWTDKSPGANILHGQWASPAIAKLGGVDQVIFPGGDGWVYSFKADQGQDGKPTLLWKFDANPKESKWILGGRGTRNNIIATPVIYKNFVYVAVGQDPEHGEGPGHLWCLDPTKKMDGSDVSTQLAMKVEGEKRSPIEHRRLQAVIAEEGEVSVDNPDSAVVWHYSGHDLDGDGEIAFEEEMHRSCGTVAIKNDLLFISDFSGLFHCLNALTGELNWTYDMLAAAWGSPLIVEDKVFIGDEDGDVSVFKLSADPKQAMKDLDGDPVPINADENGDVVNMGNSVYSTPVVANNVLYIANKTHLFAIAAGAGGEEKPAASGAE